MDYKIPRVFQEFFRTRKITRKLKLPKTFQILFDLDSEKRQGKKLTRFSFITVKDLVYGKRNIVIVHFKEFTKFVEKFKRTQKTAAVF